MRVRLGAAVFATFLTGCFSRVTFPPLPSADAPAESRAALYEKLNSVPAWKNIDGIDYAAMGALKLNNGEIVAHPSQTSCRWFRRAPPPRS